MFRANKIKGRILAMLSDDDLKQLGVAALGDRKYLLHIFTNTKKTEKSDDSSSSIGNTSNDVNDDHGIYEEIELDSTGGDQSSDDIYHTTADMLKTTEINECLGSSKDLSMSVPSKPQAVVKSHREVTIPPVIIISDEEAKEIPDPFPFPATYNANVDVALHKGNLCPATTTHFYSRIAGIMAIYTKKPTKQEYFRVAQAIMKKYPFLRNPVNAEGAIITKLS